MGEYLKIFAHFCNPKWVTPFSLIYSNLKQTVMESRFKRELFTTINRTDAPEPFLGKTFFSPGIFKMTYVTGVTKAGNLELNNNPASWIGSEHIHNTAYVIDVTGLTPKQAKAKVLEAYKGNYCMDKHLFKFFKHNLK